MEQLQGNRRLNDWQPVIQELQRLRQHKLGSEESAAAAAEMMLLQLAINPNFMSYRQFEDFQLEVTTVVRSGELPGLATKAVVLEAVHAMCLVDESFTELLTSEGFKKNGVVMLRNFLDMQLSGMLQLIDDTFNCWSFAFYWLDIVALALQAADGKPGPAAVAAAQQLMQENVS
uniref:Uncharacterized protein n=1 Tax=Tetradesmus obliquus TaxID=3088 RepID=A0A383WJ03_TETOB|eukprot:jgi/Sobl393_1/7225/SZX77447.1